MACLRGTAPRRMHATLHALPVRAALPLLVATRPRSEPRSGRLGPLLGEPAPSIGLEGASGPERGLWDANSDQGQRVHATYTTEQPPLDADPSAPLAGRGRGQASQAVRAGLLIAG